jgi:hypothetical protein
MRDKNRNGFRENSEAILIKTGEFQSIFRLSHYEGIGNSFSPNTITYDSYKIIHTNEKNH